MVTRRREHSLKIFHESGTGDERQPVDAVEDSAAQLCRHFQQATGWTLQWTAGGAPDDSPPAIWSADIPPVLGQAAQRLVLCPPSNDALSQRPCAAAEAQQLAASVAALLVQRARSMDALVRREAELAAGVPVTVRDGAETHLAERLLAVLRGGAQAVGCQAAELYLLDSATTELKLRCVWGRPEESLLEPARPLRGAIADLEALAGSAVVLEDPMLMDYWRVPRSCGAAICVPVSGGSTVHGTLWIYSEEPRAFDDTQANNTEIVAGRLAAELEREMLVAEGRDAIGMRRQVDEVHRVQQSTRPQVAPLVPGWEMAAWTGRADRPGGEFFDWSVLSDQSLALLVGRAGSHGAAAAVVAAGVRATLRAHAEYHPQVDQWLARANAAIWTGSAGDHTAAVLGARLDIPCGQVSLAVAGDMGAILICDGRHQSLESNGLPLGTQEAAQYASRTVDLSPGSILILLDNALRGISDALGRPLKDAVLAEFATRTDCSAKALATALGQMIDAGDHTGALIVLRRLPG